MTGPQKMTQIVNRAMNVYEVETLPLYEAERRIRAIRRSRLIAGIVQRNDRELTRLEGLLVAHIEALHEKLGLDE